MPKLPHVRTMFATCRLFQMIYVLCVLLWLVDPSLKGRYLLPAIFPSFTLLTVGSFIYGFIASGVAKADICPRGMSALPPKADICAALVDVR